MPSMSSGRENAGALALALVFSLCAVPESSAAEMPELTLGEVLRSVEEHYPLLQVAELERQSAAARRQSALGSFDTRFEAMGELRPAGFYENAAADAQLVQPTRLWGARFFGGYRYADGDYPSYEGGLLTDDAGEVRLGLELPLLRGGRTDPARARLASAGIDLRQLDPEIAAQRIEFVRQASVQFWSWVATGMRTSVARRLLEAAEARQAQFEGRVERGAQPPIDLADNRRLIVDRMFQLRGAERDFEQATLSLSLYLRDEQGRPHRIAHERLPAGFPPEILPEEAALASDLAHALENHPLLQSLALDRDRLEVEAGLARNELLPAIDLRVEGSRDFGASQPGIDEVGKLSAEARSSNEVKAQLRFELPVQRREARGRLGVVRARIAQLERRERFARDRIEAEIRQSIEGLEAAFDQTELARQNLELARQLRSAEVRKLQLGLSNLIDVNIREVQAATAEAALIEAKAAYFKSLATYQAAVARIRAEEAA